LVFFPTTLATCPVLHQSSSYVHAIVTTPAELLDAHIARFPRSGSLPHIYGGSASASPFSRPCNVYSRYGLHIRQVTYVTLYTRGFSRRLPVRLLRLLPAGATVRRVGFAPTERPCLCTAHVENG
jgi:hypothetical protein